MSKFKNVRLYYFLRYWIKNKTNRLSIYYFHEVNSYSIIIFPNIAVVKPKGNYLVLLSSIVLCLLLYLHSL